MILAGAGGAAYSWPNIDLLVEESLKASRHCPNFAEGKRPRCAHITSNVAGSSEVFSAKENAVSYILFRLAQGTPSLYRRQSDPQYLVVSMRLLSIESGQICFLFAYISMHAAR